MLTITAALLVAAGCGGSDESSGGDDQESKDSPAKVALGMDEDDVCTVYGEPIATEDVEELADEAQGVFELAQPDVDVDEVEVDGYGGDLETFELVALDQFIDAELVRHAATELDVEVDEGDVDDALDELAEGVGVDGDELLEALGDATGFSEATLRRALEQSTRLEDAFGELDGDDAERFDDGEEWVQDELRPTADEDGEVRCGDGVEWDEDLRDDLDLPDGEQVAFGDLVNGQIEAAVAELGQPDPVELGIAYEDEVVPVLEDFDPLLQRFGSVITKLNSGDIDLRRVGEGLGRQAADMRALRAEAAAIRSQDAYLQRNHQQLVTALDAYAKSLVALESLTKSTSQSQLDSREKEFTKQINRADRALTAWGTGLDEDPEQRPFARSAALALQLGKTANSFS
jgi:hypothetical protein